MVPFSRLLGLVLLLLVLGPSPAAYAQLTYAADAFADSVGVNLHLHYDNTLYRDNFPLVKSRLLELRVRHVRDGLIDTTWQGYYDRHNELGREGIKGLFIASPGQSTALLLTYPVRMGDAFEAYEAPNEYNQSGDAAWVPVLRSALGRLRDLRNILSLAQYPVYGPSLTKESAYTELGDVSDLIDVGNLHNYFGGHHPGTNGWGSNGYGSIEWNLQRVRGISGDKPIATTETGYWNDQSVGAVPEQIAGKYMPRMLLEQFRKGIIRTYIYELADYVQPRPAGLTSSYGLLDRNGAPKPAFTAVKELMALLSDPGPWFPIRPLQYTVEGADASVRHLAFQRRDGTYHLAIWVEQQGYDVNTRQLTPPPPRSVTVTVESRLQLETVHRWQVDGTVSRSDEPGSRGAVALQIDDTLTVLEYGPAGPRPRSPDNVRVIR